MIKKGETLQTWEKKMAGGGGGDCDLFTSGGKVTKKKKCRWKRSKTESISLDSWCRAVALTYNWDDNCDVCISGSGCSTKHRLVMIHVYLHAH